MASFIEKWLTLCRMRSPFFALRLNSYNLLGMSNFLKILLGSCLGTLLALGALVVNRLLRHRGAGRFQPGKTYPRG